ncbi:MAG: 3-hydroxyacyl-CoA dehydrogenase NAD-binding domain-containing protein [Candidatus Korarchaeum sp.]|nr:3-hydroxyacyl-CoA dehydrogenase NAD-binding domain-containing protein [Candidatus Korarchaeum sp.]MDW8034840.1 3-hydroxyacyl-CoA dehydrogenase NAD-binding domain-containing protein [Candidatus Korarchaeum sp.]
MLLVRRIAVLGAGTMGHGIAQVAAMSGYEVVIRDIAEDFVQSGINRIRASLSKFVERGKLSTEEMERILSRIIGTVNLELAVKDADFIVEAVPEVFSIKAETLKEVDRIAPPHAILATNTSSLPISELASVTGRPDRFIGMHFFNPPQLMRLVEVVRGERTSEETISKTLELAKSMGKEPVLVKKDVPGFIVNRILVRWLNEACLISEREGFDINLIDSALKGKVGLPMGAFELSDYVGLDVMRDIVDAMVRRGFVLTPCSKWSELPSKGMLGAKSGQGFYDWSKGRPQIPANPDAEFDPLEILCMAVNEAAWLVRNEVASVEEIDKAVVLGLNFPKGPLRMADEYGLDRVKGAIEDKFRKFALPEYAVDPLLNDKVSKGELGVKSGRGFYDYGARQLEFGPVIYRETLPIAWIILSRPERLNVLDDEMVAGILSSLREARRDEVRVVVITGSGKAFCAGADVKGFRGMNPIGAFEFSRELNKAFREIWEFPKPVIAMINGFALGGGLELAMACDLRVASDRAQLGQPEITLGIITGGGGSFRLPELVGLAKAKELLFTGEMIGADEALRIGLVNRVVSHERLEEETRNLAMKISERPSKAIEVYKALFNGQRYDIESLAFGLVFSTEDSREGISAFLEKRKVEFKGR